MKKHEEEHENHERWLVSYADFITLLFAFFTVLYAQSQHDAAKAEEFQKAVQKAFRSFTDFGGLVGKFVDTKDATQFIPPPIDLVPREGSSSGEMKDYMEKQLESEMSTQDMTADEVSLKSDASGVTVTLGASSFFDPGEGLVREDALPVLNKIAKVLKKTRRVLIVEGHTDDLPIHNVRFPSNWELSATRASTIVRYLQTIHRYPTDHLIAVGYADQRPVVPNDSPEHRAKNRRIEILVVTDNKALLK